MSRNPNENGTLNPYVVQGNEIKSRDLFGYKVIAVIHSDHFWTAYRGLTDWSDDRVAAEGDTVPFEAARLLFSTIADTIPHYNV